MDVKEIEHAMHKLACGDTNFDTVSRLASLIVVHDHLFGDSDRSEYSESAGHNVPRMNGSEFMEAISSAPLEAALHVLDEHMEALRIVIPKEYESVMRRLWQLK